MIADSDSSSIADRVEAIIRIIVPSAPSLTPNHNLLRDGLLDSLAVVELGASIEREFGCKLRSDFFTIKTLQSISAISQYIAAEAQALIANADPTDH